MVINANSPVTSGSNLNVNAAGQAKNASRPQASGSTEPDSDIVLSNRNSVESSEIESEQDASNTTEFARKHILGNPSGAVGVQANSRPEVVFELLQGLLA